MHAHDAPLQSRDAVLRLAHSPDPDDVFMWWPLCAQPDAGTRAAIDTGGFTFEPITADIETLNERSTRGEYEITAISCAQYPHVASRYAVSWCGASMGENYGPKLVSRDGQLTLRDLARSTRPIAVPGLRTTAALLTGMILECDSGRFAAAPFDTIAQRVAAGEFEAGVVIHEGQLTWRESGLHLVCDVGEWWYGRFGLPLPLGLNVIRRNLDERFGPGTVDCIADLQRGSIEYALKNRAEGLSHAMRFARGVTAEQCDRFVAMYVNRFTVDFGRSGREAIERLLSEGARAGLLPPLDEPFEPAGTAIDAATST